MKNETFEAIYGAPPEAAQPPRAAAGAADADVARIDLDEVRDALRCVIDPEIGLDIVTLGLVYDISAEGGRLTITHTLTTPGCPMESVIAHGIETMAMTVPGVDELDRRLVFEPRWEPGMIQEGAW